MNNQDNNELVPFTIEDTIKDIKRMVEDSVEFQLAVSPKYTEISDMILNMFNDQQELDVWKPKDLLKLLDLSVKAKFQPIEQLTKLIQSVESLYDKTAMRNKIEELNDIVNEMKEVKEGASPIKQIDDIVDQE
jgi:hypothetical protein